MTAGWYGLAILLSVVLAAWFLDVAHNSLARIIGWEGDFLLHMAFARTAVEHGWYLYNPDLGAPFGMQTYDFPMPEAAQYLLVKIIAGLFPHSESPLGIFYFVGFPLTAVTTLFVLRRCGVNEWVSVVGAMLYTFLPFHFMRMSHVMLASYWVVPLGCWMAFTVAAGEGVFVAPGRKAAGPRVAWAVSGRWAWLGRVAGCVLLGSTGAYYTFFTVFFVAMAAPIGAVRRRHLAPLVDGALVGGLMVLVMGLNLAPNLGYQQVYGRNPVVGNRGAIESEIYGLKLTQLLLPRPENRVPPLAALGHKLENRPLSNENLTSTLGLGLSIGFLALVGTIGFIMLGVKFSPLFVSVAILNLSGVLFATIGGLGAIWALIYPQVRALNRISVFLALFATVALALLLDKLFQWIKRRGGNVLAVGVTVLILVLALLEQVAPGYRLNATAKRASYEQDAALVGQMEKILPAGAMVFQLPHLNFPENGPQYREPDYDPLRYYLVSHQLRFSYGAMRGRSAGYWMKWLADMPTDRMLVHLAVAGYQGVLVNPLGYPGPRDVVGEMAAGLRQQPIWGPRRDGAFFDLRPLAAHLEQDLGAAAFAQARRELLAVTFQKAPAGKWLGGFFKDPTVVGSVTYGMGNQGLLVLTNSNSGMQKVRLRVTLEPAQPAGGTLVLSGLKQETRRVDQVQQVDWALELPPGKSTLKFAYDGPGLQPTNLDQPPYCLHVVNPVLEEVPELGALPGLKW